MLDSQLHFLFMRCDHNIAKRITQKIQGLGLLSGQPKMLEGLLEQDGSTPKEMGHRCALDKSTITSLLGKLLSVVNKHFPLVEHIRGLAAVPAFSN